VSDAPDRQTSKVDSRDGGEEIFDGEVWEDEGGDFTIFRRARDPSGR